MYRMIWLKKVNCSWKAPRPKASFKSQCLKGVKTTNPGQNTKRA